MTSFNWLHLTDFHRGMKEHSWAWPGVKQIFFDDLESLHEKSGPWDLVLFTGDLTQQGTTEEFQEIDRMLDELWEHFHSLGSDPKLFAVPGNHDLVRPEDIDEPSVLLLRMWDQQQVVRDSFWNNQDSSYRQIISQAFENYATWHQNQPYISSLKPGLLPGDFSFTLEKEGFSLGILGLNTAFLQLADDYYKGKLALHAYQFHQVCDNDGPGWVKQHDACILMTHHPPAWLNPDSQRYLNGEINCRGHFAVHLCGHLHEAGSFSISKAGTEVRRIFQGRSLFGIEHFGQNHERLHGYTAGRIEISENQGWLIFWPREARLQGAEINIVPDYSMKLKDDQFTEQISFNPHRGFRSKKIPDEYKKWISGKDVFKRVFISYAREDAEIAKQLYIDLKNAGVTPWMDDEDLVPGQIWELKITEAIRESRFFIALLSVHSAEKKGFVQTELKNALRIRDRYPNDDIFLIPVRIDECELPDAIRQIHCADLFPSYEKGLEKILRAFPEQELKAGTGKKNRIIDDEDQTPAKSETASKHEEKPSEPQNPYKTTDDIGLQINFTANGEAKGRGIAETAKKVESSEPEPPVKPEYEKPGKRKKKKQIWKAVAFFLLVILTALSVAIYFFKHEVTDVKKFSLIVKPDPPDAEVKITEPHIKYRPGIKLESGRYNIEVSKRGYEKYSGWAIITDSDLLMPVHLEIIKYALTIRSEPSHAKVRIVTPGYLEYHPGIMLKPGQYETEISLEGFETKRERIAIKDESRKVLVKLEREKAMPTTANSILLCTLKGHRNEIKSVAFSPNKRLLASGDCNWKVKLWNIDECMESNTFNGHKNTVLSVAFSPDSKILASSSYTFKEQKPNIILWDVASGKKLYEIKDHLYSVWSVAFSPDGQILASGSGEGVIKLWDVKKGKKLYAIQGHKKEIRYIAFNPNGQILASGSMDKTIKLWKMSSFKLEQPSTLKKHKDRVNSLAFSPDGKILVSASNDKNVIIWNANTGKEIRTIEEAHTKSVKSIAISPDGEVLASASYTTITLWNIKNGKKLFKFKAHTDWVTSLSFDPNGKILASGSKDKKIKLWNYIELKKNETKNNLTSIKTSKNQEIEDFLSKLNPGKWIVIVGSYRNKEYAQKEIEEIEAKYPALFHPQKSDLYNRYCKKYGKAVFHDGNYWAIYIGGFYSYDSANLLKEKAIKELEIDDNAYIESPVIEKTINDDVKKIIGWVFIGAYNKNNSKKMYGNINGYPKPEKEYKFIRKNKVYNIRSNPPKSVPSYYEDLKKIKRRGRIKEGDIFIIKKVKKFPIDRNTVKIWAKIEKKVLIK